MSRIRIIERSGIEAALARLDGWWSARSARERVMVGTLGVLMAALILIFGVVKPLQSARTEARNDIRAYETLLARMRAAGTLVVNAPQQPEGTPDQIVAQAAAGAGIAVTVTGAGEAPIAKAEGVPYDGLVRWLADATRAGLSVRDARIVKANAPGRVDAVVEFAR
ncbi:type II secretion system protein GspM [Stakelama pacifica]|uniref:General secretion pathway protein M n=1 Tax=Stakelama pacifica TaxID=517720 RepID=A0A4V3BSE0_9SPHN|nr:type II secretion system protein GspM [Stakelama pacifica]TDN79048.1 general secretion pathway protein M [Stakelama pacifica]GGO98755.1 hypothetical protein GCM10011329_30650 [Stakelama pacifica]